MHMYVQVYSTVLLYVEVRDYHHVSSSIAFLLICLFVHLFIHLFIYLLGAPVPRYEHGGQRTTFESRFSPSTMWVSGSKLRSSDLEKGAISLSHLANSTSFLRQGPSIRQQPPGVLVSPQPQTEVISTCHEKSLKPGPVSPLLWPLQGQCFSRGNKVASPSSFWTQCLDAGDSGFSHFTMSRVIPFWWLAFSLLMPTYLMLCLIEPGCLRHEKGLCH